MFNKHGPTASKGAQCEQLRNIILVDLSYNCNHMIQIY